MSLRNTLAWVAGLVTIVAITTRVLYRRAGELDQPFPGEGRTYRWRGMDVSYTVAGDPADQDFVLLHGIHAAASSDEFAGLVDRLATEYHVVAVDLPGFGRSDRPRLSYSAPFYVDFLRAFLDDVTESPVVVASSLTGAFAAQAAEDVAVDRLVLICPTEDTGTARPWIETLLRTPLVGTGLFALLTSKPSLRYFFGREGYFDPASLDDAELEYAWQSAHQPGARYAPAAFAAGTLDPDIELGAVLADLDASVTLLWGRDATVVPLGEGRELAEVADAELAVVDDSTLLPHAEHPDHVAAYLADESRLARH